MACCPGAARYSFPGPLARTLRFFAFGAERVVDRIVLQHDLGGRRGPGGLPGKNQKDRCGTRGCRNPGPGKHRFLLDGNHLELIPQPSNFAIGLERRRDATGRRSSPLFSPTAQECGGSGSARSESARRPSDVRDARVGVAFVPRPGSGCVVCSVCDGRTGERPRRRNLCHRRDAACVGGSAVDAALEYYRAWLRRAAGHAHWRRPPPRQLACRDHR